MKATHYFDATRLRPHRVAIQDKWIEFVMVHLVKEAVQMDGRFRRSAPVAEVGGRFLRVVLLEDGETVHIAFFDRGFTP